jgi:predicted secreted protein
MTNANAAYGTTITRDGNAIAELTSIGGVEISMDAIDVTSHDSTAAYREFVGGLLDAGEVALAGNFYPGDTNGQAALLTDMETRATQDFVITLPSAMATTWTFSALVTKFKAGEAPHDDKVPFEATLKISGQPTLSITASTGLTSPYFVISESAVITPDPAGDTYTYVATVLTDVGSVTVTPTATSGTITVDGNTVATNEESSAITLGAAGSVTEITIVVTETNKTPKTYTVYLSRAAS